MSDTFTLRFEQEIKKINLSQNSDYGDVSKIQKGRKIFNSKNQFVFKKCVVRCSMKMILQKLSIEVLTRRKKLFKITDIITDANLKVLTFMVKGLFQFSLLPLLLFPHIPFISQKTFFYNRVKMIQDCPKVEILPNNYFYYHFYFSNKIGSQKLYHKYINNN